MSTENREELLAALREQRRDQGRVQGVLICECSMTSCPVGEVRITVKESTGGKLVQPALKCPRCGAETMFLQLT